MVIDDSEPVNEEELLRDCLAHARHLYHQGNVSELARWCCECLATFDKEPELYRLLAVAQGTLGNHHLARSALVHIFNLGVPTDSDVANIITAAIACGDVAAAMKSAEAAFDILGQESQHAILQTFLEGLRIGSISRDDLPKFIRAILENVEPL